MEFRRHTLDNGLEIVAECNDQAYSTAVGFFVESGARDEPQEWAGVSHFLEHMIFKGTPRRSADDVNREFDEIGAQANAYTNEESTVYHAAFLPEYQERGVDLLADILRPSLREDDFEMEKQVIIEEIRMYEDMPPFGADEKVRELHFEGHPLAHSVLGTVETIQSLTADQMREYFERRYSPTNVILAVAGKVDFDALIRQAEKLCGHWKKVDAKRVVEKAETHEKFEVVCRSSATQEYVMQLADAPAARDADRYPAKMLATILGDDTGSRLYWELIDPGKAEQVSIGHYEYDGAGLYFSYMSCDPESTADNMAILRDVYEKVHADGVTEEEIERAKNKVRSRMVLASERPRGRLFAVGGDWLQRQEYRSVRDDLNDLAAITSEQITAVLAKYPLTRGTTMAVGPLEELVVPKG